MTGFFIQTLNLVIQQVDFPLQLGLEAGVNQRLASLKLQFCDVGAQTKAFDVEWVEGPGTRPLTAIAIFNAVSAVPGSASARCNQT